LFANPHFHMVAIDGVYAPDEDGRPRFYPLRHPTDKEIQQLTETLAARITAWVQHRFEDCAGEEDTLSQDQAWLAGLYAASVSNRIANGPNSGRRIALAGDPVDPEAVEERSSPLCATSGGFNLHAAVVVPAHDRGRLENLLGYTARPPFATERLEQRPDGRLSYRFKSPWRDGTTHAVFTPLEFIERLCALVPTPRAHLVRYSGVLGPAAKWRSQIVPEDPNIPGSSVSVPARTEPAGSVPPETPPPPETANPPADQPGKKKRRRNYSWSELIRRVSFDRGCDHLWALRRKASSDFADSPPGGDPKNLGSPGAAFTTAASRSRRAERQPHLQSRLGLISPLTGDGEIPCPRSGKIPADTRPALVFASNPGQSRLPGDAAGRRLNIKRSSLCDIEPPDPQRSIYFASPPLKRLYAQPVHGWYYA
jgi:hypothetical protein